MVKVDVMSCTPNPIEVISLAAGNCYGKNDVSLKRVERCYKNNHMSVFEHASITFRISGISRACSHQLVRHRLASFCQKSQRYSKVDTFGDWYVMPESIDDVEAFKELMKTAARAYNFAIEKCGAKPEDARYLLPEATKTEIVMTMNARELFHFLDMRESHSAQWEIRDLARVIVSRLYMVEGWCLLMGLRDGAQYESY